MEIEFDLSNSERNPQERGLPFSMVDEFDWATALVVEDDRADYGETHMFALGFIGDRLQAPGLHDARGGLSSDQPSPRQRQRGRSL